MSLKVYCEKCRDFTPHHFGRWPFCNFCRGRGHPAMVWTFIVLPIAFFILAIVRIWRGW